MSMNPLNDISAVYVAEVLKPQLGQDKPEQKTAPAGGGAGEEGGAKRIRQAVYDIRYRARREDIPLDQAFNQYMSHTSMNAVEKDAVKSKLGMGSGGAVKEEVVDEALSGHQEKKFTVRVKDRLSGKTYVRSATRSKISKLRSNPNISHVEMTKYGTPYEGERRGGKQTARVTAGKGLDPVGQEDSDVNNDGKVNKTDKYLQHRRNVRGAAIAKKKPVKESFSNWRTDLREVVDDEIASQEKNKIGNKNKKVENKVVINPKLSEGVELLESFELSEDYIFETVNTASEYFIEQGLNEHGVNILIEELGLDEFVDFVFQIKEEDLLMEARAGGVKIEPVTAKGQKFKSGKPTGKSLQRLRDIKAKRKEAESKASETKPSGLKASLQRQSAIASAAKQQPKKKGVLDRVAKGVLGAVKAYQSGMERHRAATSKASELVSQTAKTAKKAAGKVGGVAREVGRGASGTARLAGHLTKKGLGEETELHEKITAKTDVGTAIKDFRASTSPQLAGRTKEERRKAAIAAVLTARRGGKKLGESLDAKIQDQPTPADNTVRSSQSDAVKKQQLKNVVDMNRQRAALEKKRVMMQKSGKLPLENSYEPEGELVDEARAEEKRGYGSTGTQRQRQKKGVVTSMGQVAHPATSYSGGQNPHLRGKSGRTKEQRRASSRRYVDQPGGVYAKPENKQGEGRYSAMQYKKRDQSNMSSRFD